ncbi:ferrous iron transport protein B [Arundinibacter roseus]|uniref:Ferrous iron transport protein B n=1 Tax=Arundinibacter roseus TaxID=2070510 RepID=A0A4R4KIV8_9BACT|nr:ferrous iron transport protein B [Arundinibacter roseus]TDB68190.1 ferrous iron transport protein B [Arundinibacter roseus]
MKSSQNKIALIGNPNSGKSTLFNQLTGLRQKTGNFPGVTVEKKFGTLRYTSPDGKQADATLIDLPGIYSIYPKSRDEQVVVDILANPQHPDYPDAVIVVVDASNLQRNLLLFTEIADLGLPIVLALNMLDVAESMNLQVNAVQLAMPFAVPVVRINARTGEGVPNLKEAINRVLGQEQVAMSYFLDPLETQEGLVEEVKKTYALENNYLAMQYVCQHDEFTFLNRPERQQLDELIEKYSFDKTDFLTHETITRYERLRPIVQKAQTVKGAIDQPAWTRRLDRFLLHPIWGYVAFLFVLLVIFQAVFAWAQYPMDMLDMATAEAIDWTKKTLPEGVLNDLLTDGLMAGIGGVIIFIPQIAFLFGLVGLLEESGYMARVMVIMDKLMRKFGLNGRSVVPLISGVACAVPAIMTTRSINNPYERLLTILVTPLMSCSARLPIYTILIALVVPDETVLGILNLQGLVLLGLYLLGLVGALASAWLFSLFIPRREPSYFILEMPTYKLPRWSHIGYIMFDSVKSFVLEAGKIIVAISIILWVLASYGPGDRMDVAAEQALQTTSSASASIQEAAVASARLEASYAGHFGRFIEPAIRPLGYDWKIGIALITSFAAREVFVGTMSTIYSIGAEASEDALTIRKRLQQERNPQTGGPMYTPAVSFSLLMFYVFAMMCMSTMAVVYRETHGWKWPIIQLIYTMFLAYGSAWATYQLLS